MLEFAENFKISALQPVPELLPGFPKIAVVAGKVPEPGGQTVLSCRTLTIGG